MIQVLNASNIENFEMNKTPDLTSGSVSKKFMQKLCTQNEKKNNENIAIVLQSGGRHILFLSNSNEKRYEKKEKATTKKNGWTIC